MEQKKIIRYTILGITLIFIVLLGIALQRVIIFSNFFTSYQDHFNGSCQKIFGVVGGEDITIDQNGLAWISATDRHGILAGEKVRGKIMLLDLKQANPKLRDITPTSPPDFRPHGISLWTDKNGERFLFVINHPSTGSHNILRYRIDQQQELALNALFQAPALSSPNDIVAVGRQKFYWTNDMGSKPQTSMRILELILRLPWGSVGFFDGTKAKIILEDLTFPNGINRSLDGRQIYIAEMSGYRLSVFDRNLETNALTLAKTIPVPSGIDNLELDEQGNLWTAAHPKPFTLGEHMQDKNAHSPSQIFHILLENEIAEEIYYNSGEALDAAATAAPYKKRFLLGPVFDDHLLLCDRD